MEEFTLTRRQMADLLLALNGEKKESAVEVLRKAWCSKRQLDPAGDGWGAFVETSFPPVYERFMKSVRRPVGLSINEIASLGNAIEYSTFSTSAVQNWVKRDVRELIGSPKIGRKYTVEQAALLFLVEDLKSVLDFESIRRLLTLVFQDIDDRDDDLINPLHFYAVYSTLFDELDQNDDEVLDVDFRIRKNQAVEKLVQKKADEYVRGRYGLKDEAAQTVSRAVVIAVLGVQTAYFQSLARRFFRAVVIAGAGK